ncbi:MAG: cation diffusion facilitator family transporter [bacterium]|nr:cation diffusion facilitator family transporter [bacterium]
MRNVQRGNGGEEMSGHYKNCPDPTDCWCEVKRLSWVFGVTGAILVFEIIGGMVSRSLALWADAVHVFGDSAAIMVTLIAAVLIKLNIRTHDAQETASRINIGLLFLMTGWIAFEAIERFQNPKDIANGAMIIFAFIGGVGNASQHLILKHAAAEHKHRAHQALTLHIISDFWQSVGVVVGGILIWWSGFLWIDPLISLGIAISIARCAIQLALDTNEKDH